MNQYLQLNQTISVSNVKNIRSITIASTLLTYGVDYDYDVQYTSGANIVTYITYTTPKTGSYSIVYDYGTDKIFDEWPRADLSLSSYPRLTVDLTSTATEIASLDGSVTMSDLLLSFYVWDNTKKSVRDYVKTVRNAILIGQKSFYNVRYITPVAAGPILPEPLRNDKIVMKTLECRCPLNEEITS